MFFAIITLLVALSISAIAAWYSIVGLTAIFAAAVFPIILMGAVLEVGKITATVWLHQHWQRAPAFTRWYLSMAVIILMFITSMGIFGFLSKSHIEQTALGQDQQAVIQTIEANLSRSTGKIDRWMSEIDKLNSSVHRAMANSPVMMVSVQFDDIEGNIDAQNLPGTIDEHPNWRRLYSTPIAAINDHPNLKHISKIMAIGGRVGSKKVNKERNS